MGETSETSHDRRDGSFDSPAGNAFASDVVDRLRGTDNTWKLPAGSLMLPRVFGFCRGVERALAMLEKSLASHSDRPDRLVLLGEIIHNPWVNDYFRNRGVRILTEREIPEIENIIPPTGCAVVPAFGVPLEVERRLHGLGCEIVDTTCGDVRRLWIWAQRAVKAGFAILVFGRARHDETLVTKSRLADAGGKYLVVGDLAEAEKFCEILVGGNLDASPRECFGEKASNADSFQPFLTLAQVSQTTMLYDETMQLRELLRRAFGEICPHEPLEDRLMFQPTVCLATQERQAAASELCRSGLDLAIVVGGFGSSNTRHLYELACVSSPAFFIEDVRAILSDSRLRTFDIAREREEAVRDWLPRRRPLRIGVLAGASTPESVVGQVLQRLADLIG